MTEKDSTTPQSNASHGVAVQRLVRQGWRFFHCEDCEHRWKEATRDWQSPSGENCPRCGEWWFPYHGEPDDSLSVDSMGNLLPNTEGHRTGVSPFDAPDCYDSEPSTTEL